MTGSPTATAKGGYFASTRAPRYSVLFALPLLIGYESLAAFLSTPAGGMRNGADALFRGAFTALVGPHGPMLFMLLVVLVGIALVTRDLKRSGESLKPRYFAGMLLESAAMAIGFGLVIGTVTAQLLGAAHLLAIAPRGGLATMSAPARLMLSLGAGLYEELFFRVVLVSGLSALARVVLGFSRGLAMTLAVVVSALLFSLFHYIPPNGDAFQLTSFTFRFLSGLAFSSLYAVRGFGVTAWTHALYDTFLLLF